MWKIVFLVAAVPHRCFVSVSPSAAISVRARKLKFYTKDTYVTTLRPDERFFEIPIFGPFWPKKPPKFHTFSHIFSVHCGRSESLKARKLIFWKNVPKGTIFRPAKRFFEILMFRGGAGPQNLPKFSYFWFRRTWSFHLSAIVHETCIHAS